MKRNEKTIVIISALLIALAIVIILLQNVPSSLKIISQTSAIIVFALITRLILKPRKTNKSYAKIATKSVFIILIASTIVAFNLGLVIGFTRTFFPPTGDIFLYGFLPTTLMIVASEFFRKIIIDSAFENKKLIVFTTIALIFINIAAEINIFSINSFETGFIMVSTVIVPAIAEGLISSYLVKRAGMMPALAYRLSRGLYHYLLPIAPAFSQYLYSVMWTVLPFLIYRLVKKDMPEEVTKRGGEIEKVAGKRRRFSILTVPTVAILLTLVILVSGIFRYKMIAVASGSMFPTFDRGDAVIYDKEGELEEGDVLAFVREDRILTHRIIEIRKNGTEKIYRTKGDANEEPDGFEVKENTTLGKVSYIIKYIGLPTVLFNELIGNL